MRGFSESGECLSFSGGRQSEVRSVKNVMLEPGLASLCPASDNGSDNAASELSPLRSHPVLILHGCCDCDQLLNQIQLSPRYGSPFEMFKRSTTRSPAFNGEQVLPGRMGTETSRGMVTP